MLIKEDYNKQNVIYSYSGKLSSLKKEADSDTCFKNAESGKHYAKCKAQKDH